MRAAGTALAKVHTADDLIEVLRVAGVGRDAAALDAASRAALGVGDVRDAFLVGGRNTIRVLVIRLGERDTLRPAVQRLARRLTARAPHVLWLVAALDVDAASATLAACGSGGASAGVAAFTWEPRHVVDSDAETLCALAAAHGDDDVSLHARYMEVLGRDALTRRFYRALREEVTALGASLPDAALVDAGTVALLYVSRLLFLRFLEAKGWLDGNRDFVASAFDECMRSGGGFHRRVLLPLFFGTLNTPVRRRAPRARAFGRIPFLNGGLFTVTATERRLGAFRFADERFGALLERVFTPYRFAAREDSATWSEASVDPEMLGRAFESLMAVGDRRDGGVFYTPHAIVARVAERALEDVVAAARSGAALERLSSVRVLDPACGSGAFLVYVLERLAALRSGAGDPRDASGVRRDVLARSIFGVDRNPTAVWLCELRLWLSVVVESDERDPSRVPPLPNIDRNVRVGDALAGADFGGTFATMPGSARLRRLRERYVRATGQRKALLARALDREERSRALAALARDVERATYARREHLSARRARDLFGRRSRPDADARRESRQLRDRLRALRVEQRRLGDGGALPFAFPVAFADAHAGGGFDVVLGNPPWVRLHRIPAALRAQLKRDYVVYRAARWSAGAAQADVAPGFASQVDLAALFTERALGVLRPGGTASLLLPAKLWHALAGGGVRQLLADAATLARLEDLSDAPHAFQAAVYPSLLVARKERRAPASVAIVVHAQRERREWTIDATSLPYDATPGAPWLLIPRAVRESFDRVRAAGVPLAERFGPPRLGVKSGCNAAFVVRVESERAGVATVVDANGEHGTVESELLRPALRGDAVVPWRRNACVESIVWTHDATHAPLPVLPDRARRWLRRHRDVLTARSDAARARRWWALFRLDAADSRRARVVWSDLAMRPRALVLPPGDPAVPLNSCYVIPADDVDAAAVAAILNSTLAAAWLNVLAEPARGGYRRYLGWTVGQLPLPRDWARGRVLLAEAARAARDGGVDDAALCAHVLRAYGVRHADVHELLEWSR